MRGHRFPSRRLALVTASMAALLAVAALLGLPPSPTASPGPGLPVAAAATSATSGLPGLPVPMVGPVAGPAAGPAAAAGWQVAFQWHVPVLMYHRISTLATAGRALPGLVVSPVLFRAQLEAARRAGWRTITASQLARDMSTGSKPAPRSFVITIDDGSEDGWTEAYPILRSMNDVATYFVPSGRIGHPNDLSAAQVSALEAAGMEIANHSIDHVPLAFVAPAEARYQVDGAEAAISGLTGSPPLTLAYPFGNWDRQVMAEVAAAGIELAFTTVEGCSETIGGRLDEPRMRVRPGTQPAALVAELRRCGSMTAWG